MWRRPSRRWRRGALAWSLALLAAVALSACSGEEAKALDALESDPLTSLVPPGTTLDRKHSSEGTDFGTGSPTIVSRTFRVSDGEVSTVAASLAASAREAGWDVDFDGDLSGSGQKRIGSFDATVTILGSLNEMTVGIALRILH